MPENRNFTVSGSGWLCVYTASLDHLAVCRRCAEINEDSIDGKGCPYEKKLYHQRLMTCKEDPWAPPWVSNV